MRLIQILSLLGIIFCIFIGFPLCVWIIPMQWQALSFLLTVSFATLSMFMWIIAIAIEDDNEND